MGEGEEAGGQPVEVGMELGEVIAVGPGRLDEKGKRVPMEVKKGDKILFAKYAGSEIKFGEDDYIIMREDDILGVLKK